MKSAGYFTWMKMIFDTPSFILEGRLGLSPGALNKGYCLYTTAQPPHAANIVLRGSTRWSDGMMDDGRDILDVIESAYEANGQDITQAQQKVARFLNGKPQFRAAKVVPLRSRTQISYPSSRPGGIPQLKLHNAVEWRLVRTLGAHEAVTFDDCM